MSGRIFPQAIIPECKNFTNAVKYLGIGITAFMVISIVLLIVGIVYYNKKIDPPTGGTRADTEEDDKNKKISNGVLITLLVLTFLSLFVGIWTVVISGKLNACISST